MTKRLYALFVLFFFFVTGLFSQNPEDYDWYANKNVSFEVSNMWMSRILNFSEDGDSFLVEAKLISAGSFYFVMKKDASKEIIRAVCEDMAIDKVNIQPETDECNAAFCGMETYEYEVQGPLGQSGKLMLFSDVQNWYALLYWGNEEFLNGAEFEHLIASFKFDDRWDDNIVESQ